jgi:hypothetical protein
MNRCTYHVGHHDDTVSWGQEPYTLYAVSAEDQMHPKEDHAHVRMTLEVDDEGHGGQDGGSAHQSSACRNLEKFQGSEL